LIHKSCTPLPENMVFRQNKSPAFAGDFIF